CGHVLVFEMGRGEERCANIRTSLCGLVLMFETRGEVREHQKVPTWALSGVRNKGGEEGTPEHAHKGTFWCSGCGDMFSGWGTSWVSCGRQEWCIGAFSVE